MFKSFTGVSMMMVWMSCYLEHQARKRRNVLLQHFNKIRQQQSSRNMSQCTDMVLWPPSPFYQMLKWMGDGYGCFVLFLLFLTWGWELSFEPTTFCTLVNSGWRRCGLWCSFTLFMIAIYLKKEFQIFRGLSTLDGGFMKEESHQR